jgi:colanic acid biosynthesis glycosyl transferase WcaI
MIVPHYAPDLGPSAPLFTMLSTELVKRGHQIIVLTTVPHYPTGQVPAAFRGKLIQKSLENGVEVIRTRIPSLKRSNLAGRLLQFVCYQFGATLVGLTKHYDAVFVANPALWVWLPFLVLVVIRRKPAIFSIYDVYPDVGIRLGIFRHKLVISAVEALERFCLDHSVIVRIISESFRTSIHRLGVPDSKIALIYDWVDMQLIKPLPRENLFSRENGLCDHFVVLYAGNLGLSQGLEHVLNAAEQLASYQGILFVFVGDGTGRENLLAEAEKRRIKNIRFLPFQPRELLPEVLASSDISLVILKHGVGINSLPNKTLSILASSRPLLASVDQGCETYKLVQQAKAGLCVPPEDPAQLAEAILTLKQNEQLREQMGKNGREWTVLHHSPQMAAQKFEAIFYSILPGGYKAN